MLMQCARQQHVRSLQNNNFFIRTNACNECARQRNAYKHCSNKAASCRCPLTGVLCYIPAKNTNVRNLSLTPANSQVLKSTCYAVPTSAVLIIPAQSFQTRDFAVFFFDNISINSFGPCAYPSTDPPFSNYGINGGGTSDSETKPHTADVRYSYSMTAAHGC